MTMKTFSSILPFTRRFGVRGVTCMTNGAQGGGGGTIPPSKKTKTESAPKPAFRFFVLGAGFSYPAGLPLAEKLWGEVYRRQRDNISGFLERYVRFKKECDGVDVDPNGESFNFEAFMGFLDIEHSLEFRGGDTLSSEGNGEQLLIRQEIGRVLTEHTPAPADIPPVYLDFARELRPHDYVLTFNYDTLLERALERVGQSYRLFPDWYSEVYDDYEVVADSNEVAVYKMHGSVDWFHKEAHDEVVKACDGERPSTRAHPMFGVDDKGTHAKFRVEPILKGLQHKDNPLRHIWRLPKVADVNRFYAGEYPAGLCAPWLLSPSTAKFVYLDKLLPLWNGLGKAGGANLGLVVIGYSLPQHDDYVKQPLFAMTKNYQGVEWGKGGCGMKGQKPPVVLIDHRNDAESQQEYRRHYGFVDPEKARFHFSGFDNEALDLIRKARCIAEGSAG